MPEEHLAAKVIGLQVKIEGCMCIFIWKFAHNQGMGHYFMVVCKSKVGTSEIIIYCRWKIC